MDYLVTKVQDLLTAYGFQILGAIAIFIIGRIVAGMLTRAVSHLLKKSNTDDMLVKFVSSLVKIALMTFVIIMTLGALGVQTLSIVAVLGAAGLAIGLALQGSLSNFAAGVMLIIFRPFKVGDYVDAGGTAGTVVTVHIFHTELKTPDNRMVVVPNGSITSGTITNFSAHETRRIDFVFGIGYNDDIRKAKEVLERIIREDSRILRDPEPVVKVLELADSSVNFAVRPWVNTADYWNVYFDITEKVKTTFDAEGISIPFPQTDVHLIQESPKAA